MRARLRAGATAATADPLVLRAGGIALDLRTRRASVDGRRRRADGARSSRCWRRSCATRARCCSREQLLSHVWGYDFDPGSNVVDVYVGYLRRKLGGERFETVRGMGYRLKPEDDS